MAATTKSLLRATSEKTPSSSGQSIVDVTRPIPTETATTLFQLGSGVFGGIAALVASSQLAAIAGATIPLYAVLGPVLLSGVATVAAAFLIPT